MGRPRLIGRVTVAIATLTLTQCAWPYRPTVAVASVLPADAFERVLLVVQARYPHLAVVDRPGFRIQSAWITTAAKVPAQVRASVFRDDQGIEVVVERRVFQTGWVWESGWSSPRADRSEEAWLASSIEAALQSS